LGNTEVVSNIDKSICDCTELEKFSDICAPLVHMERESKSTLDRKIGQSVFDFKAEDRQDHYLLL
jgi:hypothetical protein